MRFQPGFRLQLMLGGALLVTMASPAFAADKPVDGSAGKADAAAPQSTEGAQIQDIIVTATKRETNLQKTPIAISVMSSKSLTDRHVQSLYDLADGAVPSLRVATFEARQTALTIGIRGIVPLDANQPAREQGVGIYIDGVYLGRQHGLNAALFDVERVEVLKGPQGTLFGRNTEGGALSIVTKVPTGKLDLRATLGKSNYGGYNGDFHLDLPEFANISIKLDGVIQHQDPTIVDPLPGSTGWNYFHRRGGHAAVQWKPTDAFKATFSYDNGYDANTAFYSQLLNVNPNNCVAGPVANSPNCVLPGTSPTAFTGAVKPVPSIIVVNGQTRMTTADIGVPQQPSIDKTHGFTLNLNYKLAPWIELRSITSWRGVSSIQWDNSGGAHRPPVVAANTSGLFSRYSLADLYQHQFSQELQAVGSFPGIDYAAGLYYFRESSNDDAATPSSNMFNYNPVTNTTTVSIVDPCTGSGGFGSLPGCRSIDRASVASSKSYAAFGQATYTPGILNDTLHLTVGGRYTHDIKHGALVTFNNKPSPSAPLDQTTSRFNPLVILAYDAAPGINLYAKYSTGYRAGGASSRSLTYRSFGPEDVTAYEIGAKTEFLDHHVRLNLAAYIMDRKGSQIDFSNVSFDSFGTSRNTIETVNAPGITKIRGIEADLTVNPLEGLSLTGSYAYTYTKIPPVINPFTGVAQNVFIVFTPRNAASGSFDYRVPLAGATGKLHLDANYSQSTQTFDQYATHNDASFIVNGRLSLADITPGVGNSKMTLSVWVRNMFDYQYVYRRDPSNSLGGLPAITSATGVVPVTYSTNSSIANILGDYGNFNAPRTFGIEASVSF